MSRRSGSARGVPCAICRAPTGRRVSLSGAFPQLWPGDESYVYPACTACMIKILGIANDYADYSVTEDDREVYLRELIESDQLRRRRLPKVEDERDFPDSP